MKDMILYHGSKNGLSGAIKPMSREKCDFGRGFYMGENKNQATSLVVELPEAKVYKLKFNLSQIPEERILTLNDEEWLLAILANREICMPFNKLSIAHYWKEKMDDYDVIIGKIADDKMQRAVREFVEQNITDKALVACLKEVDYGNQIVAKNEFACSLIEVLDEVQVKGQVRMSAIQFNESKRSINNRVIKEKQLLYRKSGLYIDEFVEKYAQ